MRWLFSSKQKKTIYNYFFTTSIQTTINMCFDLVMLTNKKTTIIKTTNVKHIPTKKRLYLTQTSNN